ncbi:protein of unknown function [Candidatus Nitrotoga arctica]|uniref:Uncharacterized protein n=1 Tax=Candidatus Nitrotoga arctica TaxID=453162 RepID=A0ABN8AMA2_9PROT|nr:protein of unknown function [Candidatus Nitrotoga arctica]
MLIGSFTNYLFLVDRYVNGLTVFFRLPRYLNLIVELFSSRVMPSG